MFELDGRVVLVTGGNGGIGLGMAEACAQAGADIAIWGTNPDKNAAAQARLKETGRQVVAQICDVGDEQQVIDAFAATVEQLGKVDAVFANSGIGGFSNFTDMTLDEWRRVMRVNLEGAFLTLRQAARHMVQRGEGGSLVTVSSVSAIDGAQRMVHYGASKGALTALTRGLAVELARHNIRVNSILPGWINTDMNAMGRLNEKFMHNTTTRTPVRRWGEPEDLGPMAVFLANPEFLFHTGQCEVIDGGYTIF
ncbi:MAG: SDR family oxidoreductase [Actinobacteria bacterium]|nr:SDR family oxidoreductase [Actinomycetota bacterium]